MLHTSFTDADCIHKRKSLNVAQYSGPNYYPDIQQKEKLFTILHV